MQSAAPAYDPSMAYEKSRHIVVGVGTRAIIGVAITVVVALALLPIITDFVNDPALVANLTATQITLLNLIPTFYIIGVVVGVVVAALVLARTD